ncbi:hypothetical protein L2755_14325 [Shewanella abyssi]|uniref:hypothetical protein n=1 Tax=Shewanella abyssi TaxID=311789 RepID=UPI00200CEE0E|nr:hypothetical protein [Shewanella abyssi]MCL1050791.1 hypothetical protein [Shewanella abyssi]
MRPIIGAKPQRRAVSIEQFGHCADEREHDFGPESWPQSWQNSLYVAFCQLDGCVGITTV